MFKPDETAALVTDPQAIEVLRQLVAENPHESEHACGYHWLICFRDSSGNVKTFAHNEDCESYRKQNWRVHWVLNRYFRQIRSHPSAFVFNVSVPVTIAPETLVSRHPNLVFFLDGTDARLPYARIRLTAKSPLPADRKDWDSAVQANRDRLAQRVKEVTAGIRHETEGAGSTFGGGEIDDFEEVTLHSAESMSFPPDVMVLKRGVPTRYVVQVVAADRSPAAVKAALERELGVGVGVARYPEMP